MAMTKVGLDLGVFELLSKADSPLSVDDIAKASGGDPAMLGRILRYLSSHSVIEETSVDHFTANNVTRNLTDPAAHGAVNFMYVQMAYMY